MEMHIKKEPSQNQKKPQKTGITDYACQNLIVLERNNLYQKVL